jgi:hypothetical protein
MSIMSSGPGESASTGVYSQDHFNVLVSGVGPGRNLTVNLSCVNLGSPTALITIVWVASSYTSITVFTVRVPPSWGSATFIGLQISIKT